MTSYTGDPWHQKLAKLKLSAKRKKPIWELSAKLISEAKAPRPRRKFFSATSFGQLYGEVRWASLVVHLLGPIEMEAPPSPLAPDKISTALMPLAS